MPRRTLSDALDPSSRICESLNIISTDARAVSYINRFIERAITKGHFWGTTQRYSVNVTRQLFTLPPQFAVAEKIAIANAPIPLRNEWYSFQANAMGFPNDPTPTTPIIETGGQALFRGNYPTFLDVVSGDKARLQCDVSDDVGTTVTVFGFDGNGNFVRTKVAGVWQDGEPIVLSQSPGTLSVNTWSRITDIQKPATKGQVWMYDYDGTNNTLIANWLHYETRPYYPRYLLPTIPGNTTQVDLIGKLAFVPVSQSADFLIIGNLEAIRLGSVAVKRQEEGMLVESEQMFGLAISILEDELNHYRGSGFKFSVEVNTQFGELVPTLI